MSPDKNRKGKFPVVRRDFRYRLQNETVMSDKLEWIEWMNLLPEERFAQAKILDREYRLLSKGSEKHGARFARGRIGVKDESKTV